MSTDDVVVARFAYRHEAALGQALLRAAGIESAILADDAGWVEVALSLSNSVRLVVRSEDANIAHEVLMSRGTPLPGDGPA